MEQSPRNHLAFLSAISGVTNRIWMIVCLFLGLILFTHYLLPQTTPQRATFTSAGLKSKNYINASDVEPNPFAFCPIYGPGDENAAKYGPLVLSQTRLHLGSGARVQRVIQKALLGQPVTMSILGGSVSACHGAGDDPISPHCYPSRFFEWWNSVFPHPASELTNGAMRRTTSGYYGYCSAHHVPDDTDLVVLELDADDPSDQDTLESFELLVRSILLREDQPAVIILGHFSPQVHTSHGFAGPDHWHNIVAQFYDVPHVSTKAILYPDYMNDPSSINQYFADPMLANSAGHQILSDVLVAYIQSQVCSAWSVATGQSYDALPSSSSLINAGAAAGDAAHGLFGGVGLRKGVPEPEGGQAAKKPLSAGASSAPQLRIPPSRINSRPNNARAYEEIAPFCASANDLINPLPPSLFYGSGWYAFHSTTGSSSSSASHYWYSTLPASKIRIPIHIGAGDVGIYYLREPIKDIGEGSAIECWVDDNYAGAKVIENAGDVGEPIAALEIIDRFVGRGSHFVECQLLGEEGQGAPAFKIIGIFAS